MTSWQTKQIVKKIVFWCPIFHFVEVGPRFAIIVPVAMIVVLVLAHVMTPVVAISTIVIPVRAIQNMTSEYEYPYTYLCLAIYYVYLQNVLCMMKIWKLHKGIHIYVLRITFQPLWFLVDKWRHIVKGYFHISLVYIQKITKELLNLNFALTMLIRKYSQFWALTRFD